MSWSPDNDGHPFERLLRGPSEEQQAEARRQWEARALRGDALRLTLTAFSGRTTLCRKCGHDSATAQYVTGYRFPEQLGHSDGLLRHCEQCGFGWFERCRDGDHPLETL